MPVLNREEFFGKLQMLVGDDTSEETLKVIEDFNDTYESLSPKNGEPDWKQKYEENDKMWSQRYRDRFFGKADGDEEEHFVTPGEAIRQQGNNVEEDGEKRDFDELFEEREG